jgi:tripartite ATP-independent transporter DctM subunit
MSTVLACAGFGAICGSSIATAATMTKVAYPSMNDHRYSDALAAGVIAAGGTLGILIPPSTIMVIYGIMTDTSIAKLFAAGVLPGLVAVILLCTAVQYICWRDPAGGPAAERSTWRVRLSAVKDVWAVAALFVVVMGGIYGGVFTATEGAGIGAFGAFCFALARRTLSPRALLEVLVDSARTTAMLFMILVGALIFANFVNYTSMPADLKAFVSNYRIHPTTVMVAICVIYVVLGTAMEELSMILLTVPVFFPLVVSLGFDPVWFGIIIVVVVQIGLISPPVGMNMFVVKSMLPRISTATIFRGVTPFVFAEVVLLGILVFFPAISLVLPRMLKL